MRCHLTTISSNVRHMITKIPGCYNLNDECTAKHTTF
ncbi:hypothetical protein UGMREWDR_CDS0197 [Aeromonas phage GomatiRiver_11]|nr:hypothetical protein UGMREWDR_CDS0197 [Aeromonas phage GomatiRiver_11]